MHQPGLRRTRPGAVLIVAGLIAALLAIMPVAQAADTTVRVTNYPGTSSYFDVSLGGGASRPSFCVAHDIVIYVGPTYDANVYSIETLPPGWVAHPENLDLVNWVLNNRAGYSNTDVQNAIWVLTDGITNATSGGQALAAAAQAHDGFVPGCGEYYLTLLTPFSGSGTSITKRQTVIIYDQNPACQLTVIKAVVNHGGTALPGDWLMNVSATSPSLASFPGAGPQGTTISLNAGPFSVTESGGPAGYFQRSATGCSGTAVAGSYTCTITNEQETGRIIVRKLTSPEDAPAESFGFAPSWGESFRLADGESHDSGLIPTGIYSVAELLPLTEGWVPGDAYCSDGSAPHAIGLSPGEAVTCTFENAYDPGQEQPTGSLTIRKMTSPAGGAGFTFAADGLGEFSLADGESETFNGLAAGAYTVAETPADGWALESVECDAGAWSALETGATVNLAEGEHATCTFINRAEETGGAGASLTIIKQTLPAGGAEFGFDAGALGTFTLNDGGSRALTDLEAGTYTITETPADGWELQSIDCDALDWSAEGATLTATLGEGEHATCTFVNAEDGTSGPGELPYTGPRPGMMPLLVGGLCALLLGLGMVMWPKLREDRV